MTFTSPRNEVSEYGSDSFSAQYEAVATSVRSARTAVAEFAAEHGAGEECVCDVRLAVSEAATNVVRHAYAGGRGEFRVLAMVTDEQLLVVVRDEGCGLGEASADPGFGAGIQIMELVAADCELHGAADCGTTVELSFSLR